MNIMLEPSVAHGSIKAIASKSAAHRLLICAAFAKEDTLIRCDEINEDISATVRCLSALGATIVREAPYYRVTPIKDLIKGAMLDCGESGSTMRFLVPVVCLLGADASFLMSGRLPDRPLSPLREELERCGISFSPVGSNPLTCLGKVEENNFSIVGNVSSQFISGLLFAIAVSGKTGCLKIIGKLESAPYVDLTVNALRTFGVEVATIDDGYVITKNNGITSATEVYVEGDWSNAAFPLALGAIGKEPVTVTGLNVSSSQGDRKITDILSDFGADVKISENSVKSNYVFRFS